MVNPRLEPGEAVDAIAAVWSARPSRHPKLSARFRDHAVLTDRRLMVWECRWLTRRPRRRVLADRLDAIVVTPAAPRGSDDAITHLRVDHTNGRSVVFDFGRDAESQRFARALVSRTAEESSTPLGDIAWPS